MAASSSSAVKPNVGILSLGDMGMGVAKLLRAHDYPVLTVSAGRSQHTVDRIKSASVTDLPSDEALLVEADIILSIVPPRDATATARRIYEASKSAAKARQDRKGIGAALTVIDLNAVSPRTVRNIAQIFDPAPPQVPSLARRLTRRLSSIDANEVPPIPMTINFVDGGIIGPPPSRQADQWKLPSIPISGPEQPPADFMKVLNMKHISESIGSASALKACFASLTKGFTALSILSFTTAHSCNVLPELQSHLKEFAPSLLTQAEKGLTGMPPKAYRWVDEMKQIGETFGLEGGFIRGLGGQDAYEDIAEVYKFVADGTVLGQERTNKRKRGTTADDVAAAVKEGIDLKRQKAEGDEKLALQWRGSWS